MVFFRDVATFSPEVIDKTFGEAIDALELKLEELFRFKPPPYVAGEYQEYAGAREVCLA